ncbi:MAG: septal ring lytic transglycosylase RlpA family protein [Chitinophagaceae bacterium]|nr:septal ring lytic transglycosylase RlpA family protein [Chitinophagaceae bacterium]
MKRLLFASLLLTQAGTVLHAQNAHHVRTSNKKKAVPEIETGVASYYGSKFKGRLTASGQRYDPMKMTAAHNRLPMGTRIKVTNIHNRRSVIVVVNDRLHYRNKRLVDLSRAAALKLGYTGRGLTKVRVEVLGRK